MFRLRGVLLGVVFMALAVGFAAAMPAAMRAEIVPAQAKKHTDKPEKPKAHPRSDHGQSGGAKEHAPEEEAGGAGHGAVVSAIAKCDVKGRWHGEAVRSIAQDKDADLEDVAAACAAAQAAAAAAPAKGKPEHAGPSRGKPAVTGKPSTTPKETKPAKPVPTEAPSSAPTEPPGSPVDAGRPADKGNSGKKP